MNWDSASVSRGLDEIAAIRHPLLLEFKRLLDEFNNCSQSERYYDIIAGDWLEHFAHLTYAAMAELSATVVTAQNLSWPIPVTADIRAYDSLRCQRSGLHDHLREAVAQLLTGGTPAAWTFSGQSVQISSGGSGQFAYKFLRIATTKEPKVLLVHPYFKCGRAEIARTLLKWRNWAALDNLCYPVNIFSELDAQWRLNQACAASPISDFLGVLKVLLPLHLPVALLEGLAGYRKEVLAMPVSRPKAVYSANALHGNMAFKLLAAEWQQEGTRLLYHQHGGGYGIDKIHALEQFESRVADRYYTWGWRTAGNSKVRPLPPAALYSPSRRKKYVLLSCVDYPPVVYRIHFQTMPGNIGALYRETCAFLKAIPERRDLLIRPSQVDYSGNFVDMMNHAASGAVFDDRSATSFERFAQSRLVVHNYLGTGYLETLALNVPTICFYDPDVYVFRAEAEPLINELERVGILHQSGFDAARFVVALGSDPQGWWLKSEVQLARKLFIERYANFSSSWKREWEAEFSSVIESPHH